MSSVATDLPRRHRYTVTDFYRMAAAGVFHEDDRVELIHGEIIDMAPVGSRHMGTVLQLSRMLERAVGERALVSVQNPIVLGERSQPRPDLALLRPRCDFYKQRLPGPEDVWLIVEVADSSLAYDRDIKLPLYAAHDIPEAWLVDLDARQLLRCRQRGAEGYADCRAMAVLDSVALPDPPGGHVNASGLFELG